MSDSAGAYRAFDIEVEQALLGSIIVDQKALAIAAEHVQPEHFSEGIHAAVFELMIEQDMAGKRITPLTLAAWLKHDPRFEEVGGARTYLSGMAAAAPAMAPIEDMAKIITGHALRRMGLNVLDEARAALGEGKKIVPALADVVQVADEIAAREAEGSDGTQGVSEVTDVLLRDIERQAVSEKAFACKTNIHRLDDVIGGLVPGNAIFVGGRPGMGKSIVGPEWCIAAARQGWEPDYFSLEMPARELGARMACSRDYETAISEGRPPLEYAKLIQMTADATDLSRASRANLTLRDLPITIFDFEDVTMARIAAICRARAAKAARLGVRKLFVIDHMHLIEPDDRYRGRKVDELTLITKRTKQLAKRTGAPVVMLCQLNREVEAREDKRPRMSDFRDSGSIEQDADVLIGLYRPAFYDAQRIREAKGVEKRTEAQAEALSHADKIEFIVLKNRNGRTDEAGGAWCHINVACAAIRNEKPVNESRQGTLMGRGIGEAINDIPD